MSAPNMESVEFEGKTYLAWEGKIKEGDLVWNPISDAIMEIDSEDDIHYANENYYLATEVQLTRSPWKRS
jgi:hypothetical protein